MTSLALAADCGTAADVLGVARTISVPVDEGGIGTLSYDKTLELAPKEVVLTFDDGPSIRRTPGVLAALRKECVQATFFVVGEMVARAPWLLQQIATEHHTIGTHTWSHRYLNVIRQGAEDQIVGGLLAAAKAVGPQSPELSPFFRFPGFGRTARLDHFLDAHGMVPFSVDVVGDDWTRISSDEVLRRTLSRLEARRGGILLLHDIHARTLAMLPRLLTELKARGFSIVHIVPEKGDAQTALASLPPLSSNRMRLAVARIPTAAPINLDLARNGQGDVVMLADLVAKDGKPQVRNYSDLSLRSSAPSR